MRAKVLRVTMIVGLLAFLALYGGLRAQNSQPQPAAAQDQAQVLEIPLYPEAQLQFELLLTEEDFLGGIKKLIEALLTAGYRLPPPRWPDSGAPMPEAFLYYTLGTTFGLTLGGFLQQLISSLEEFRVVGYEVKAKVAEVTDFYDKHFEQAAWRRNFWMRQPDGMNGRLYSLSRAGRLRAAVFLWVQEFYGAQTSVVLIAISSR